MKDSEIQLPLGLGLRDGATLENFVCGPNGEALGAVEALAAGTGERLVYLWGERGTGKTHLVQALCRDVMRHDEPVGHVPMHFVEEFDPTLLAGLERLPLVCIDDVDAVAGVQSWEQALFHLYNSAEESGTRLLVTGRLGPRSAGFSLPDLASRWATGLVLQLRLLDDVDRCTVLQRRAAERGFQLSDEVATFLIRRHRRDMHSLLELLDRLDWSALAAKRRLTIPFVKSLLDD